MMVTVDPAEPLLAGHFPGFAIFPGVCLIECAHRAARSVFTTPVELATLESARFLCPVFPGDEVAAAVSVDGWRCSVRLTVGEELAAVVRLRFRPADPP